MAQRPNMRALISSVVNDVMEDGSFERRAKAKAAGLSLRQIPEGMSLRDVLAGATGQTPQTIRESPATIRANELKNNLIAYGSAMNRPEWGTDVVPQTAMKEKTREFNRLTRGLAGSILKSGSTVPEELRRTAEYAMRGTSRSLSNEEHLKIQAALTEDMRQAKGIHLTGLKPMQRALGMINGGIAAAGRMGWQLDLMDRGGAAGTAARADFMHDIFEKAANVMSSTQAQNVFKKIGEKAFGSALAGERLVRQLATGLRLGGPIGIAVQAGFDVVQGMVDSQQRAGEARLGMYRTAENAGIGPAMSRNIRRSAETQAMASMGYMDAYAYWLAQQNLSVAGIQLGHTEGVDKGAQQRYNREVSTLTDMQKNPLAYGVDPGKAIQRKAAQLGKLPDEMTVSERRQAVDDELKNAIAIKNSQVYAVARARGLISSTTSDTSGAVRFGVSLLSAWQLSLPERSLPASAGLTYDEARDPLVAEKLKDIRAELTSDAREKILERRRRLDRQVETAMRNDPQLVRDTQRAIRDERLRMTAYRQRHKVTWDD